MTTLSTALVATPPPPIATQPPISDTHGLRTFARPEGGADAPRTTAAAGAPPSRRGLSDLARGRPFATEFAGLAGRVPGGAAGTALLPGAEAARELTTGLGIRDLPRDMDAVREGAGRGAGRCPDDDAAGANDRGSEFDRCKLGRGMRLPVLPPPRGGGAELVRRLGLVL
ncbi:hypothetical protein HK405_006615, partial [Cladochytrium tenue]